MPFEAVSISVFKLPQLYPVASQKVEAQPSIRAGFRAILVGADLNATFRVVTLC